MDDDPKSIGFGYTLVDGSNDDAPSGPPLLDHDESGYLQNFFDNPNNIDPSFLAGQAARGGGGGGGNNHESMPLGRHHANWMMDGNSQQSFAAAATAVHQGDYGNSMYGNTFNHQNHPGHSDDVYAAARLLQGHHGGQHMQDSGFGGQKMGLYNYQHQSSNYDGIRHQQHQHHQSQQQAQQAPLLQQNQQLQLQRQQSNHENVSNNGQQSRQQTQAKPERADPLRARPLNFGSDSKFRMNKYAAPKNQPWPDTELVAAVLAANPSGLQHNPWEPPDEGGGSDGLGGGVRKVEDPSGDEAESGNESLKRKRSPGDDEGDESKSKFKSARRKGGMSPVATKGNKRSPAGAPAKASKENLSEEQKRANHIQSEQKRRNLIRQGFEDANRMVPELRTSTHSKSNMLLEAAKFMRELKTGNDRLDAVVGVLDTG